MNKLCEQILLDILVESRDLGVDLVYLGSLTSLRFVIKFMPRNEKTRDSY